MARFFLVSVGTSFISEYESRRRKSTNWRNWQKLYAPGGPKLHSELLGKSDQYRAAWRLIAGDYTDNYLTKLEDIASCSAEMSSLLKPPGTRLESTDRILLVPTATPEGEFCAHGLKTLVAKKWHLIGSGPFDESIVEIAKTRTAIPGLGSAGDPDFATRGLPHFLAFLQQRIAAKLDEHTEVILVPTGGYKALIPYMVIAGILEQVPNRYVYEESDAVLELPPLPLHVDLRAWVQIQSVIDTLKDREPDSKIYPAFKKRIAGLLVEENGLLKPSGLETVLGNAARALEEKAPLVRRAEESPLLSFLDKDLKKKLLQLAGIGHLIWHGDRVPEMVDHGLRHHNDLFLLAERILLQIFYYKPDFLAPHELFTLLGALLLHDCGHVVGKVDLDAGSKRLLPTDVRDHHHVLGYLRLKEWEKHGGSGKRIINELKWSSSPAEIWKNWLHAIAVIGLYHRKKMALEKSPFEYHFFGQNGKDYQKALKEYMHGNPLNVEAKSLPFERAALLVSFLRVIDGLDEQASRTGGATDVLFHLDQLDIEAKEDFQRAEELGKVIASLDRGKHAEKLQELRCCVYKRLNDYTLNELKGHGFEEIACEAKDQRLDPKEFEAKFESLRSDSEISPLLEEYAYSLISSWFKRFQHVAYEEKRYISGIRVESHKCAKGEIHLTFKIETFDSKDEKRATEFLSKELSKEYFNEETPSNQVVKKHLNEAGLYLDYGGA